MRQAYRTVLLGVLCLAASCTVKDERSVMPSYLQIIFAPSDSPAPGASDMLTVSTLSEGYDTFRYGNAFAPESRPDGLLLSVPRGYTKVGVFGVLTNASVSDDILSVPTGTEADPLWAHASVADCRREHARDTVRLHKQYCNLTVTSVNQDGSEGFGFRVEAPVAGMDVYSLSPVFTTIYRTPLRRLEGNRYEVRLPRQGNDNGITRQISLTLVSPDGEALKDYPLGEYMQKAGYDWSELDLADFEVDIDFVRQTVIVHVLDWDTPWGSEGIIFTI